LDQIIVSHWHLFQWWLRWRCHGGKVHFALSSSSVFSRSDTSTDLERFYNSVLDFLDDLEEQDEVVDLLNWWDWCVFPWIITNLVVIPT
jgi:hypothetical protein